MHAGRLAKAGNLDGNRTEIGSVAWHFANNRNHRQQRILERVSTDSTSFCSNLC